MENSMESLVERHSGGMLRPLFLVLTIFLAVLALKTFQEYRYLGQEISPSRTISVSGMGDVVAVPDIATLSFTVEEEAADVPTAQGEATEKNNKIVKFLKDSDIEEKDIKTTNYAVYPVYEYTKEVCPIPYGVGAEIYYPCPSGKQVISGYRVSQTLEVKIRDTKKAGEILSGVGGLGVSNVYGPNFGFDDEEKLKEEARSLAIQNARDKAERLADELGVRLGKVVNFSESGIYPVYFKGEAAFGRGGDVASVPAPELPTGESKITSNVTILYEIR